MQNLLGALDAYEATPRVLITLSRCCQASLHLSLSLPSYSLSSKIDSFLSIRRVMSAVVDVVRGVSEMLNKKNNYQHFAGENVKLLSVSKCVSYEKKIFVNRV
jgi:hypothetical protein